MISKILIPTDFSPAAWQAVQYGLSLAHKHEADITLLHVYPSQNKYMSWLKTSQSENPEVVKELDERMRSFTDSLESQNGTLIDYHVTTGSVTNEILNFAQQNKFDLIIIGANSGSAHNQPGSNTAEIIRNAGFPVLVIPGIKTAVPDPS